MTPLVITSERSTVYSSLLSTLVPHVVLVITPLSQATNLRKRSTVQGHLRSCLLTPPPSPSRSPFLSPALAPAPAPTLATALATALVPSPSVPHSHSCLASPRTAVAPLGRIPIGV